MYCLVDCKEYPTQRKLIMNVLRGHTTTECIQILLKMMLKSIIMNFMHIYTDLYNSNVHNDFQNMCNPCFIEPEAIEILKTALKKDEPCPEIHEEISDRHFSSHYLGIF